METIQRSVESAWLAASLAGQGHVLARTCQQQAGPKPKVQRCGDSILPDDQGLFNLPLRQAVGMAQSLLKLAGLDWQMPDFSTISRRQKHLAVTIGAQPTTTGLPLLVDSTDIKMLGEGEWKVIASVGDDGAYDTKGCHEAIARRGAQAIIPTRKNAKPWKDRRPGLDTRNAILAATRRLGRKIWKKWTGYHRRSLVETKMRCFKLLGERVMARDFDRQVAELQVRAAISIASPDWGRPRPWSCRKSDWDLGSYALSRFMQQSPSLATFNDLE